MGHPCTASIVRAIWGTSTDWQWHDQWPGLLQNLDSNCCWTTGNHGNAGVAQATGAIVPGVTGGMLALPERTIIGHRSWPPPLGSNHTGILISGNPTAKPTQWVGLNTARGIKVSRIKSAGDIDSSQAGPGAAIQIGCTGTSNMKMRHPGCHHMMAWQLTATMVRGGNAGCLPSLYRPSA